MKCTRCGNQLSEHARFCESCGLPVNSIEKPMFSDITNASSVSDSTQQSPKIQRCASGIWVAIGIIFPIVGLILYLTKRQSYRSLSNKSGLGAIIGSGVVLMIGLTILAIWSDETESNQYNSYYYNKTTNTTTYSSSEKTDYSFPCSISGTTGFDDDSFSAKMDCQVTLVRGKKVLIVTGDFNNKSSNEILVNSTHFACYADNNACTQSYYTIDDLPSYQKISGGRSGKVCISFELPSDADEVEVEYSPFVSDEKFVIKVPNDVIDIE